MNYYREKVTFLDRIWLLLTLILTIYIFFFQYAVRSYNGIIIGLSGCIILFGALYIFVQKSGRIEKSLMGPILFFVIISCMLTVFYTAHGRYGADVSIRMIEYVLVSYSVYLLLQRQPRFIEILLWCICLSITFLGAFSLISGVTVTSAGAKGIEGLNANIMSSFFVLATFCSFYLFWKKRNFLQNIALVIINIIIMAAQISAASRRGFIVIVLFWTVSLLFGLIPYKSKSHSQKKVFLYALLVIVVAIALICFQKYLLDNTVLGARLQGSYDGGDAARARYQTFAWEQFKKNPILGIGLGGIAYYMGAYSHSMYYELLSCTGVILTCVFLVGLLRIGVSYWKTNRLYRRIGTSKQIVYVTAESIIFWLCLLISGYAVVMIYDFNFYISLGVLAAVYKNITVNGDSAYLQ